METLCNFLKYPITWWLDLILAVQMGQSHHSNSVPLLTKTWHEQALNMHIDIQETRKNACEEKKTKQETDMRKYKEINCSAL